MLKVIDKSSKEVNETRTSLKSLEEVPDLVQQWIERDVSELLLPSSELQRCSTQLFCHFKCIYWKSYLCTCMLHKWNRVTYSENNWVLSSSSLSCIKIMHCNL